MKIIFSLCLWAGGFILFISLLPITNLFFKALPEFTKSQKVLLVYAHMDDEIVNGGLIKNLSEQGHHLQMVILSDGEANKDSMTLPCGSLTFFECRRNESLRSAQILGIKKTLFLGLPDGKIKQHAEDAIQQLSIFIKGWNPDLILTLPATGLNGHPDHIAVHDITNKAVKKAGTQPQIIYSRLPFPFSLISPQSKEQKKEPFIYSYTLSWSQIKAKVAAVKEHKSQATTINQMTLGLPYILFFSWIRWESYESLTALPQPEK